MIISKNAILAATLLLASYSFGGSCANHVKINSIANIQIDGGDILFRSDSFIKGQNFSWPSIPANVTFRIPASQSAEFKKNSLATLLTAKSSAETLYLQVSFADTYVYSVEKISVGTSTMGLDCGTYP